MKLLNEKTINGLRVWLCIFRLLSESLSATARQTQQYRRNIWFVCWQMWYGYLIFTNCWTWYWVSSSAGSSELHVHHVERQFSSGRKNVPRKKLVLISCPVQHCTNVNHVPPVRMSWWNCTGERFGEFNTAMNQTSAMLYPAFTIYNRKNGNTKFRCSQGSLGT